MEGRRGREPAALVPQPGEGTATETPTHGPRAPGGGHQTPAAAAARTLRAQGSESGRPRSAVSSANCPWEQDGGPSGSDATRPDVRAKLVANQSRPGGQAVPLPALREVAACWVRCGGPWATPVAFSWEFGPRGRVCRPNRCVLRVFFFPVV